MKKEIINRICKRYFEKDVFLRPILEEELPDFQRIDCERLRDCFEKASNGYVSSHLHVAVKEYNSTLPPALVPLPKEMPALWHDAFTDLLHNRMQPSEFYSLIRKTYGTPQKQNLPSVEELAKEVYDRFRSVPSGDDYTVFIAQHLHDKYALHPREWWQDLKEGDKFMWKGQVKTFSYYEIEHKLYIEPFPSMVYCPASDCTPYTPPSAQDIIAKHNLSDEEVKILREGKCT